MSSSPYAKAPSKKLDEIIRLAEARLAAQLTLGIAADQRAMTFVSFLAAVEGVVIAAYATLKPTGSTKGALLVLFVGFAIATVLALIAAQPVAWDIPGGRPNDWLEDIKDGDDLHNGRAAMAGFYDEMIVDNDTVLSINASTLRGSLITVVTTLIVAGVLAIAGL